MYCKLAVFHGLPTCFSCSALPSRRPPLTEPDHPMDELKALESAGFTLPSSASIAGSILFGIVGFAAWRYGKKASRSGPYWIGIALMAYPCFIGETWILYAGGALLCAALFVFPR